MRIVDTKGQKCPAPLIATKKVLKEIAVGESFKVETDNETSFNNLRRFLQDNTTDFEVIETDGVWIMTITKTSGVLSHSLAEDYCSSSVAHFEKGDYVVVIASDKMGEGDDELGHLLMHNFIMALKDLDRLPGSMVFYNSGVKLAWDQSPVAGHLKDLEKMGVDLLLCATCISHYSLEKSIGAGTPSNMYVIAEAMTSACNIIKP
jgi:selenium metabolism protein YedF